MLVERIGLSSATVKIVTGEVASIQFDTKDDESISFESFKTSRTQISIGASLAEASPEEIEMFTNRKRKSKKEEQMSTATIEPEVEKVDLVATVVAEPKPARVRRQAEHAIELDPPATTRKKLNPCSYTKEGGRCDAPAPYRLYWIYRDGEKVQKSFCRACREHAKPFAEKHGVVLPDRPRRK
ncbi:MAG: hypothetical protein ACRD1P_06980 [Thermoanaerobaculia bacterium]